MKAERHRNKDLYRVPLIILNVLNFLFFLAALALMILGSGNKLKCHQLTCQCVGQMKMI
jgi:hypothetical protein